jgi:hypothetical protein
MMLDGFGYVNQSTYVEAAETSNQPVLIEDVNVASGETVESVVVFEIFEDAPLGMLMWQPELSFFALVDFTEEDI